MICYVEITNVNISQYLAFISVLFLRIGVKNLSVFCRTDRFVMSGHSRRCCERHSFSVHFTISSQSLEKYYVSKKLNIRNPSLGRCSIAISYCDSLFFPLNLIAWSILVTYHAMLESACYSVRAAAHFSRAVQPVLSCIKAYSYSLHASHGMFRIIMSAPLLCRLLLNSVMVTK